MPIELIELINYFLAPGFLGLLSALIILLINSGKQVLTQKQQSGYILGGGVAGIILANIVSWAFGPLNVGVNAALGGVGGGLGFNHIIRLSEKIINFKIIRYFLFRGRSVTLFDEKSLEKQILEAMQDGSFDERKLKKLMQEMVSQQSDKQPTP